MKHTLKETDHIISRTGKHVHTMAAVANPDEDVQMEQNEEKGDNETQQQQGKRFEVKKWMPIAMWSWNIQQDNCAICRNSLYEPSIDHQSIGNPDVTIAWGSCNHCFHLECIQRWLKTRNVCPLCTTEWEYQKIQKVV
eukprot:gb/GECG01015258.1/.p1 GENE.gb/GECG01015258.1/~~gb/GECG01015258.1/.p1  ORF type:complete len:138 (+),score=15.33 gb/GECG01015258.1/:1-414(+)